MEVVILLALIGLLLVAGALALFTRSLRDRDWQHVERLSLFPMHEDSASAAEATPPVAPAPRGPK